MNATFAAAALIAAFSLVIILVCLWALLRPRWIFDLAYRMLDASWLMPVAVGARLVLGVTLLWVAAETSWPLVFRVLGGLSIVAALTLPFIGMRRIQQLVKWMDGVPRIAMQVWMVFGITLGVVLLFGVRNILM